ncbi:MAG: hypothetical protein NTV97_33900 [Alphaproteobacteria bacterium]|nr:hypothetical protein [Alphaproteobacteria bacterium]
MTINFDERPWLILCEGEGDKRFLDRLLAHWNLTSSFQVKFPTRGGDASGGRSKFGRWLDLAYQSEDFTQHVKAVLVMSDNDLVPAVSLAEVVAGLKAANFPAPTKERTIAKKDNYPDVCILMIPNGTIGGLETLCIQAAYGKWPISAAVDAFVAATPAKDWTATKQSKMKLQAILAATCASRPEAGFAGHWREKEQYHLPIDSNAFLDIAEFLGSFGKLLEKS